ncbi:MAG: hypothetical protein ACYTG6_03780 [Planctomycetota bacterium]|jgi:transcription elongation factor Elf1
MADTTPTESPEEHRTFDCPWCGAIASVPSEILGEHLVCGECGRGTKVTEQNTTALPPTAPPPDAPHGPADLTFECPWCGALEAFSSMHLGEHVECPACRKSTKLTSVNTKEGAPPGTVSGQVITDTETSGSPFLLIAAIVVLAAVGAWFLFGSETGSNTETTGDTEISQAPPVEEPPVEEPEPAEPEEVVSPLAEAVAEARDTLRQARLAREQAMDRRDQMRAALDAWLAAHPDVAEATRTLGPLQTLHTESARLMTVIATQEPTPATARAYNASLRGFIGEDPDRIGLATALLAQLRAEPGGPRVASWESMNFHAPGVREAIETLLAERKSLAAQVPAELLERVATAEDDVAASSRAVEAASRRLEELAAGD